MQKFAKVIFCDNIYVLCDLPQMKFLVLSFRFEFAAKSVDMLTFFGKIITGNNICFLYFKFGYFFL